MLLGRFGRDGISSIVDNDLKRITSELSYELNSSANSSFLITGAGGFLDIILFKLYYWNRQNPNKKLKVFACDNFLRGKPDYFKLL